MTPKEALFVLESKIQHSFVQVLTFHPFTLRPRPHQTAPKIGSLPPGLVTLSQHRLLHQCLSSSRNGPVCRLTLRLSPLAPDLDLITDFSLLV